MSTINHYKLKYLFQLDYFELCTQNIAKYFCVTIFSV